MNLTFYSHECTFYSMNLWRSHKKPSTSPELKAWRRDRFVRKFLFPPKHHFFPLSFKIKPCMHCLLWHLNKLRHIHSQKKCEEPGKAIYCFSLFLFLSGHRVNVRFAWEAAGSLYRRGTSNQHCRLPGLWRETGSTCATFQVCFLKSLWWAFHRRQIGGTPPHGSTLEQI